jgi:hypothetical protein
MHELIITRILNHGIVTLGELEDRATQRGLSLSELYTALDKVHRDKRIKRGVRQGEVYYEVMKPNTHFDHLVWWREHYPPMDETNDGSGIDVDFSWLFLRTVEERDAYKAEAKGVPMYVYNKKRYD